MIFIKKYKKILIIVALIILNFVGLRQIFLAKSKENGEIISWENENDNTDSLKSEVKKIKVDIKGAVVRPGVYEMLETDTLNNLILASGGFNEDAYTANLGLSSLLKDGLMVYVYTIKEYQSNSSNDSSISKSDKPANSSSASTTKPKTNYSITSKVPSEKEAPNNDNTKETIKTDETPTKEENNEEAIETLVVNINTASITELVKLNGIGEAKAAAIINYRDNNGLFKNIEEIMNVKGIGPSIYAKIKEYITI